MLRLTTLLAATALAASRLGLLVHELVGHGATALAVGGRITGVHLFWFAGGWIRYHVPDVTVAEDLAVALGGIALEAVVGTGLWLGLRAAAGLGARLLRALGATLVVHAMCYLAAGAWHGYGDGRLVHELAGDATAPLAITAGLVACGAGWLGARQLFGALVGCVPAPRHAGALLAIAVAGGLNAGLAVGELALRRDATYAITMQPERERTVARELAAWQRARVAPVSDAERAARELELAGQHRDLPFGWLLGGAVAVAVIAGAARSRQTTEAGITPRLRAIAVAVAVISTAAVIALDVAFH